jgi:hypothetical protein
MMGFAVLYWFLANLILTAILLAIQDKPSALKVQLYHWGAWFVFFVIYVAVEART